MKCRVAGCGQQRKSLFSAFCGMHYENRTCVNSECMKEKKRLDPDDGSPLRFVLADYCYDCLKCRCGAEKEGAKPYCSRCMCNTYSCENISKPTSQYCVEHSCSNCIREKQKLSDKYCAKCKCSQADCSSMKQDKSQSKFCNTHGCVRCGKFAKISGKQYCNYCICKVTDCNNEAIQHEIHEYCYTHTCKQSGCYEKKESSPWCVSHLCKIETCDSKKAADRNYCTECDFFLKKLTNYKKPITMDDREFVIVKDLIGSRDFSNYIRNPSNLSKFKDSSNPTQQEILEMIQKWAKESPPENRFVKRFVSVAEEIEIEKEQERKRIAEEKEKKRRLEQKRVETERIKQQQLEERKRREARKDGLIKAGIQEYVVNAFIRGAISESEMYLLFDKFKEDGLKRCKIAIKHIFLDKKEVNFIQGSTTKDKIAEIQDVISNIKIDGLNFCIHKNYSKKEMEYVFEWYKNSDLNFIMEEITSKESKFDMKHVLKLYNDYSFKEHLDALKEVFQGADWQAVAVKHGFFQY